MCVCVRAEGDERRFFRLIVMGTVDSGGFTFQIAGMMDVLGKLVRGLYYGLMFMSIW